MKDHKAIALKLFDRMQYVYPRDVATHCSCPEPSARRILRQLMNEGHIERVRPGCFKKATM